MANIHNHRAVVDAARCTANCELVGVHGGQVVYDENREKVKRGISMIFLRDKHLYESLASLASLASIFNDGAIVDGVGCAPELELMGVHSGQVIHDVLQDKGK